MGAPTDTRLSRRSQVRIHAHLARYCLHGGLGNGSSRTHLCRNDPALPGGARCRINSPRARRSAGVAPVSMGQRLALDSYRATAARSRVFNACSSIFSPSWKSMARLVLPSRLELNRREGSFRAAPLAKVIFTTLL